MNGKAGGGPPLRAHLAVLGALLAAGAVIAAVWLGGRAARLVGTDSIAPQAPVAGLKPGQELCVRDLLAPRDASAVRLYLAPGAAGPVPVSLSLRTAGATIPSRAALSRPGYLDFPVPRVARNSPAILCLTSSRPVTASGFAGLESDNRPQAFLDHKPLGGRVSVWFVDRRERTLVSDLPAAARRASVFRAGFVGPWTYLALLILLPLLWFAGLRTLLRGERS